MSQGYRPEIEGLRAFAILPILAFHLDVRTCPGGFIGVDIFFVISGFLITGMILSQGQTFSFKAFYVRRIYRLLPALIVTLAATIIAGWSILGPREYAELSKSALFAAFGLSNFYFNSAVDYFNAESYAHILLHTWSLGLEEQFYLVWPALLVFASRYIRSALLLSIGVVGLGSLLAMLLMREDAPQHVFYLMPFRMFEFAIGAGFVLLMPYKNKIEPSIRSLLAAAATICLLLCIFMFHKQTPWPSAWCLIPCLATGALLLTGDSGPVGAILKGGIARFFGRISYSLYLVHWPLISLYRAYAVTDPHPLDNVALGLASIVLATILYWTVESTFRIQKSKGDTQASYPLQDILSNITFPKYMRPAATTLLFSVCVTCAAAVLARDGFPSRLDKTRAQFLDKGLTFAGDLCSYKRSRCVFGDRNASRIVFVIGDSHALNLIYGLDQLFRKHGIKGVALYDNGCLYLYGTKRFINGTGDKKCARNVAYAYDYLAQRQEPVILASSFASGPNEIGYANDSVPIKHDADEYYAWAANRLTESFAVLRAHERPVIIFKQMYSTGINLPKCLTRPRAGDGKGSPEQRCIPWSLRQVQSKYKPADEMVETVSQSFLHGIAIDPKLVFCTAAECIVKNERSELYFRDTTHLTNAGSDFLIRQSSSVILQTILAKPKIN